MPQKDFCTLFDVIMIYTKQSMPLAVDNSEMAVIGLSLGQGYFRYLEADRSQYFR